jgi:hypothetical protein
VASWEEAPEEMIFLLRDAASNTSVGEAKRDAEVVIPRRAVEHLSCFVFGRSMSGPRQNFLREGKLEKARLSRAAVVGSDA